MRNKVAEEGVGIITMKDHDPALIVQIISAGNGEKLNAYHKNPEPCYQAKDLYTTQAKFKIEELDNYCCLSLAIVNPIYNMNESIVVNKNIPYHVRITRVNIATRIEETIFSVNEEENCCENKVLKKLKEKGLDIYSEAIHSLYEKMHQFLINREVKEIKNGITTKISFKKHYVYPTYCL